jgi:hypothetical protein
MTSETRQRRETPSTRPGSMSWFLAKPIVRNVDESNTLVSGWELEFRQLDRGRA